LLQNESQRLRFLSLPDSYRVLRAMTIAAPNIKNLSLLRTDGYFCHQGRDTEIAQNIKDFWWCH
jgi:hypothetical protein